MSKEVRKVDLVTLIGEKLMLGFEPDVELVAEAEDLGISVEAIRLEISKLYEVDDEYEELDFN